MQGYLILAPVWGRSSLPEPDDTISWILRTARFEECGPSGCPAFSDLQKQLSAGSSDPEVALYRNWAATGLHTHSPTLSLILLAGTRLGTDLLGAYNVVCMVAPILFGVGFAYLLSVLWGTPAAGCALFVLAFKVFPDTGLNFIVPSNLCMGLATFVWARVLSRNGAAPLTLALGCLAMIGTHPVGVVYSTMSCVMALWLSRFSFKGSTGWVPAVILVLLVAAALLPTCFSGFWPYVGGFPVGAIWSHATASVSRIMVELTNLRQGLFGLFPLFCAAVGLGFLTVPVEQRKKVTIFLVMYIPFLIAGLSYPLFEPADVFFRMWIPFIATIFGAVGYGFWYLTWLTYGLLRSSPETNKVTARSPVERSWPVFLFLIMAGYIIQSGSTGCEQVIATAEYYRKRLPLKVCTSQVNVLTSKACPGDRVLYLSMLVMPYYLVNGAKKFGAIYHHPALDGTDIARQWLSRPDLRFVVAYNPLMHHPSFEGLHERRWGIGAPHFHFTPFMDPPRYGPVIREDRIMMADYKWLEIEPRSESRPRSITLRIDNPVCPGRVTCLGLDDKGHPLPCGPLFVAVPGEKPAGADQEYEGTARASFMFAAPRPGGNRVVVDLTRLAEARRFRIIFPGWRTRMSVAGISFDDSELNWPWDHKAQLILMHKRWEVEQMVFSFDPVHNLPEPLRVKTVSVVNDCGSSVLFQIDP